MIQIHQRIIPKGRRNRPGRKNPMEFITIHNTGNTSTGAHAEAHSRYLLGDVAAGLPVSWHYTVDCREAWQHLPDNEDAFHASDGAGAGNRRSIGVEICVNQDGNLRQATDNAVWLVAELCRRHNIPPANIRQHNHFDPRSQNCPRQLRAGQPYSWAEFIQRVTSLLDQPTPQEQPPSQALHRVQLGAFGGRDNANNLILEAKRAGFSDAFISSGADGLFRVQIGAFRDLANATAQRDRARQAGFADAFVVTAEAVTPTPPQPPPAPRPTLTVEQAAQDIFRGRPAPDGQPWGTGATRRARLTQFGLDPQAVQARVNQLMAGR
ncbi:MAG: N-acetylmuramoyl-L-alanine amidase [Oscillospiraceae bacterium]|nr:N-acetylmuramoyl-L-alanine amidase [Oscillospiraceae bacterium]